jgi:hypothetical protein
VLHVVVPHIHLLFGVGLALTVPVHAVLDVLVRG